MSDYMDHLIPLSTPDGTGYLDQMELNLEQLMEQVDLKELELNQKKDPMVTPVLTLRKE